MPTPPEHELAEYALNLAIDEMDTASRERVADIVADTFAVAIGAAAAGHDSGRICEDAVVARLDGAATTPGRRGSGRAAAPRPDQAALCNGTWAEVLDYQDTVVDPRNNGHAAVTIVPAAVAVAESVGAPGRDLVSAVAAGIEVTIAIVRAVGRAHRAEGRGFRTTSIGAPVGAAVACAKLLGLTRDATLNAMGIAGASAPKGLMPSLSPAIGAFGMDKDYVNGLAARLAVDSAYLAGAGMTGADAVVTGENGLVASHAHGDPRALVVPAGGTPNLRFVALKKFAACYGVHTAMEAAAGICADDGIAWETIEGIEVCVKADSARTLGGRTITNHMAARFSLPYSVATAVVRGANASIKDFEDPAIADADVLGFMDRIAVHPDPELTRFHEETGGFPARVRITADGRTRERRIDYPPGSHERPMGRDALEAKFRELTADRWPAERQTAVWALAARLPELANVRELTGAL